MAQERVNAFDFWGAKTLIGPELKPGDKAPPFRLSGQKGQEITSDQFAGREPDYDAALAALNAVKSYELRVMS